MSLQSLQNYAEWYYTKYFPSINVLHEKIAKKAQNNELTEEVMGIIRPMLIEKNILESRVHEYSVKGKTPYYIRQKLAQKKFAPALIEEVMTSFGSIFENAETYRKVIQDNCKKAARKGFSRKRILYELQSKYPDAHTVIDEEIKSYDDVMILWVMLPRMIGLHPREKTIQKCLQRGFTLRDVQRVIAENNS